MLEFLVLAQQCAPWVAPQTMAAIVKTESGFNPLSIGVNGGARLVRQPTDKAEAVATAKSLIEKGYNIDLGLGQVNSSNLSKVGLSVDDTFDACKNIAASATILHGNYQAAKFKVPGEQAALKAALSAYNTGSFSKGFANGYVQKVINNASFTLPSTSVPPVIVKSVTPVPLMGEQPVKKVAKLSAPSVSQAVKLKAENARETIASDVEVNVYRTRATSVMVY